MLNSQPLSLKYSARFKTAEPKEPVTKVSERVGHLLDDIGSKKPTVAKRFNRFIKDARGLFFDVKHSLRSLAYWLPIVWEVRPWEGFGDGFMLVEKHLKSYINYETKHGHSTDEYIARKVNAANKALKLIHRLSDPDSYDIYYQHKVDAQYPKYLSHITRNSDGSTIQSGRFVPLGDGWVGEESGRDPRRGYFEFMGGTLTQLDTPDQTEADRLLAQLDAYEEAVSEGYRLAREHFNRDLEKLGKLLRDNMYDWWD